MRSPGVHTTHWLHEWISLETCIELGQDLIAIHRHDLKAKIICKPSKHEANLETRAAPKSVIKCVNWIRGVSDSSEPFSMSKSTSEPSWLNSSPYASAYIRFASIPFREHPTSLEIPLKMDYISPSSPVLYSALCVSPLLAYFLYTHVIRGSRLPPSPPSDPIVGHVFRVPQSYAWKTYASWKKTLGKWIHYNIVTSIVSIPRPIL